MTDQASTLLLTTARLADGRSVDVVVTDGFSGNIALKTAEGIA